MSNVIFFIFLFIAMTQKSLLLLHLSYFDVDQLMEHRYINPLIFAYYRHNPVIR